MATTFVRMPPELGKRKSVEIKGIFSQWRLDLQGASGAGPDQMEGSFGLARDRQVDRSG